MAVLVAISAWIAPWEGTKYTPYRDVVGVLTVCRGITGPEVIEGKTYTEDECRALERPRIAEAWGYVIKCLPATLSRNQTIAAASLAYNAGAKAVCGSTLHRKAWAGDLPGMCREFDKWVYAGGKRWRGLIRRRAAERQLCETPDA